MSPGRAEAFFSSGSETALGGRPFRLTALSAGVFGAGGLDLVCRTSADFLTCFDGVKCATFGETEPSSSSLSLELDS